VDLIAFAWDMSDAVWLFSQVLIAGCVFLWEDWPLHLPLPPLPHCNALQHIYLARMLLFHERYLLIRTPHAVHTTRNSAFLPPGANACGQFIRPCAT